MGVLNRIRSIKIAGNQTSVAPLSASVLTSPGDGRTDPDHLTAATVAHTEQTDNKRESNNHIYISVLFCAD